MGVITRDALSKQIKEHKFAPVYLLHGNETYLRDAAVKMLSEEILKDLMIPEFNAYEGEVGQVSIREAISSCRQMPSMAERRVTTVFGVHNIKNEEDEKLLTTYLAEPNPTTTLILVSDQLDKRRKLSAALLKSSVSVEFLKMQTAEIKSWTLKIAKAKNLTFEPEALEKFIAVVDTDIRRISNEITKLIVTAHPSSTVTLQMVDDVVIVSNKLSEFDLTEHLLAGRSNKAMLVINKLLRDKVEPLNMLGLIAANYRRVLWAKEALQSGASSKDIFQYIRMPFDKQSDFLATVKNISTKALTDGLHKIARTDVQIKTSIGGGGVKGSKLLLEMLVVELLSDITMSI